MKRILFLILCIGILFLSSCSSARELRVILQFDAHCAYEELVPGDIQIEIATEDFVFVGTSASLEEITRLKEESCLVRSFQPRELPKVLQSLEQDLDEKRNEKLEERKLQRTLEQEDITNKEDLQDYLEEKEEEELPSGILSPYQLYVTPDRDAVQELAVELKGIQEIYDASLSWVWVSEEYLNGVSEYWYTPEEFLTLTPSLETNPAQGRIASDCSEQANTLASVLIADGYPEENVRVVLGLVDFGGQRGGHAWVEIYEDGRWLPLDATSGAYYDESTGTLVEAGSLPYTYFLYYRYPSVEVWYYYNNVYFMDLEKGISNAPEHWETSSKSWLHEDLQRFE